METNKMLGLTLLLVGVLFVVTGARLLPSLMESLTPAVLEQFLFDIVYSVLLTVVQIAAGLLALWTGWKMFKQKTTRKR